MNLLRAASVVLLVIAVGAGGCAAKRKTACRCMPDGYKGDVSKVSRYGEPMKMPEAKTVCIEDVLDHPKAYDGKMIRMCGRVESVCAVRGCWLKLTGKSQRDTVFVKFTCPVKGRLIPMEAVGHPAVVEGTLTATEISQEEARHYAEDAGRSPAEIARIVGPQQQLRMKSPVAMIQGL